MSRIEIAVYLLASALGLAAVMRILGSDAHLGPQIRPATSAPPPPHRLATFQSPPIAGYVPDSDVAAQSAIDVAQKDIPTDFTLAKTRYTVGGNSKTAANSTPAVSADDAAAFGLRLFEKLCDEDENTVVMSPLVIAGVLALAAAGATPGGKTEAQLLGALGVQTAADHPALAARVLAGNGATVRGANAVFTRASIKPSFVSLVQSLHGSEAAPLGTSYAPVNAWVAEKTEGRIRELFTGSPSPDIVALLVSAVFFKGSWAAPFRPAATQPASFVTLRGEGVAAQLMQNLGWMPASREVAALGGAAAVRLDYGDGGPDGEAPHDYCALFVLPRQAGAEGLAATVAAVARASLPEVLSKLRSQRVQLSLPRLRATYGISSVKTALRSLGVAEPFDGFGGFGALTDDPKVLIDDVLTKAAIELDEEGTLTEGVSCHR